jgi:predicted kinase
MLVVMTGLPGTGKTMLAEAIGMALPAAVVSVDPVELALWRAGLPRTTAVGIAAYAVAAAVAEQQLRLGHAVIADAVNAAPGARQVWQSLAKGYDCELHVLEVVCSDEDLHRERVELRNAEAEETARREQARREQGRPSATTVHAPVVTWAEVERARRSYRTWPLNRLVLDSAADFEQNIKTALRMLAV